MEQFYIGRKYDLKNNKLLDEKMEYEPADLNTHAVITGMTGSGKTGLCINLMEEAALQGIPAILIDPKGDLTNLLLHFPELAPADFQPWLDADTLSRQNRNLESASADVAAQWKNGLADWDIDQERIRKLAAAADFAIYTPGSDAGLQISVLSSMEAPQIPWEGNHEILREKISSMVTALLGLVGYEDIDPLRSREHILISNIFEYAWSHGKNLDLTELILQVQTPPFEKLGAFPVDGFFPSKDRTPLAMSLNNILASPGFQSWREGAAMDIPSLLFSSNGRPRHSVFYIAHLSDGERMFFVTLLLSAMETWMRTQSGSTSLRALLYFDEMYGYLPPSAMPPSKTPLLRMLKQARAFGVGLVLATQNPGDIDYKALSNAGTWFVGKLQTERDKNRLLDGLQSASADLDRNAYSDIISALGKRVFLLHNIHASAPVPFQTRWTMNFLAGPLTRPQIPTLNKLVGAVTPPVPAVPAPSFAPIPAADVTQTELPAAAPIMAAAAATAPVTAAVPADMSSFQAIPAPSSTPEPEVSAAPPAAARPTELEGSVTPPVVPTGLNEYYLPVTLTLTDAFKTSSEQVPVDAHMQAVLYRPVLLASAQVRFVDRRYGIDSQVVRDALVDTFDKHQVPHWDDFPYDGPGMDKLEKQPSPQARYASLEWPFNDAKLFLAWQKDFMDWVFRTTQVNARANQTLKVFAGPDVSPAEFRTACSDAARQSRDSEIARTTALIDKQIAVLQDKLAREQRDLSQGQNEYESRKREETGNMIELGASIFGIGRKKSITSQLSKSRMSQQAKARVDESTQAIKQYQQDLQDLEHKRQQAVQDATDRWAGVVNQITDIPVLARKSDVYVNVFGIAWEPFYLIRGGGELYELPASSRG